MDMGLQGKWALVCAASKGLGKGCAAALVGEGANVVITARGADALQATADELRRLNPRAEVRAVAGDITTAAGRAQALAATIDAMAERGFGRIVNITSGAVKAPIDILGLSNGARSGLTGFVAGLARQPRLASRNVTINNLLPGPFDTDRLRATMAGAAAKGGRSVDDVMDERRQLNPTRRFGTAQEFGAFCAFVCSVHAGYLTGQNLLLDGGAYPGTF